MRTLLIIAGLFRQSLLDAVVWHKRNTDRSKRILFFSIFSDKVITISNYVHKELPSFLKKKSTMVYNPFFFTKKKNNNKSLSELYEIKKKKKIIGFISNFSRRKKPDFFIKIAKELIINNKEQNLFFVMFGDYKKYESSFQKKIIDQNLTNNLKLYGFVEQVDEIMSYLDLIICPAKEEPFGRVLIEAMKNKVPIIASGLVPMKKLFHIKYMDHLLNLIIVQNLLNK